MGGPGGWSTKRRPVDECFRERYEVAPSGCWLWKGYVKSNGYGLFMVRHNKAANAHKWAYEHFTGPVPVGMELDHLCRVRHCVNPAHLEAVDHSTNMRRSPYRRPKENRTHCPKGHPYEGSNLSLTKRGDKICRICRREQARRWLAKVAPQPCSECGRPWKSLARGLCRGCYTRLRRRERRAA